MFKIIILMVFLGITPLYGQGRDIEKAYNSIVQRGLERGYDLNKTIKNYRVNGHSTQFAGVVLVDSITQGPSTIGMLNLEVIWKPKKWYVIARIYILKELIDEPELMEIVLAHEIGHFLNIKHTCQACPDIMSSLQLGNIPFSASANKKRWDNYFELLNNNR